MIFGELSGLSKVNRLLRSIPVELNELRDKTMEQEAKGFVRDVIQITPPYHQGLSGLKAGAKKKEGLAGATQRIQSDLKGVFQGVELKGSRKVTHLFGDKTKGPWTVPTKEKHADVRAIYDSRNARRGSRKKLSRGQKAAWYVSASKLKAVEQQQIRNIGILMSGWGAAAVKYGVALPPFAKRHGTGQGSVEVVSTSKALTIVISNKVPYGRAQQLQRLAESALKLRANKLERRLPFLIRGEMKRIARGRAA